MYALNNGILDFWLLFYIIGSYVAALKPASWVGLCCTLFVHLSRMCALESCWNDIVWDVISHLNILQHFHLSNIASFHQSIFCFTSFIFCLLLYLSIIGFSFTFLFIYFCNLSVFPSFLITFHIQSIIFKYFFCNFNFQQLFKVFMSCNPEFSLKFVLSLKFGLVCFRAFFSPFLHSLFYFFSFCCFFIPMLFPFLILYPLWWLSDVTVTYHVKKKNHFVNCFSNLFQSF